VEVRCPFDVHAVHVLWTGLSTIVGDGGKHGVCDNSILAGHYIVTGIVAERSNAHESNCSLISFCWSMDCKYASWDHFNLWLNHF
jgi:hypothetical protein